MRRLALAHGSFNLFNGLWPLVSMRTFEAVFGPKVDRWLVHTVGGLLTTVAVVQLGSREPEPAADPPAAGNGHRGHPPDDRRGLCAPEENQPDVPLGRGV